MDYYINLHGKKIPVTREVYKAYCKGSRKERYFRESDIKNKTFFYDALDTEELNGSDLFWDSSAESVEETAEKHLLLESLRKAAEELSGDEQELLCRLYVYGQSLRACAKSKKLPVTTLQARHQKLLKKLRKKLEKQSYIRSI